MNGPDAGDYSELCDDWIDPADANGNLGLTASASDKVNYPPGTYVFTITATDLSGMTETGMFSWVLTDRCSDRTCPNVPLQEYTITGMEKMVAVFGDLSVPGCPLTFTYTVTAMEA